MRNTAKLSGKIHAVGNCHDCGKKWDSINADGLAAQHHYKTGHTVSWEVAFCTTLTANDSEYLANWKEQKAKIKTATSPIKVG